jgi:hypothetical protein
LLSVATYADFGVFRYGSYLNEWDLYHYYLGTKYAHELGYRNLYGATLIADVEGGLRYRNPRGEIRDLDSAKLTSVLSVAKDVPRYRKPFSDERWREFVQDVTWFKMQLPKDRWSLLLVDHGYNGTPAWSFVVGGLLTRHLSVRNPVSRWLMLLLDPLLLLGTMAVVAWAFGPRAALFTVIFVGSHYLFSWGHLKGALLRTDFAMCSVLAVCLVKKGWYKLAGGLLGWAILSRAFPVLFLIGPGLLFVRGWIRSRRIDRQLTAFFLACALTVGLLVIGSCIDFGGIGIWTEWREKIGLHYAGGSEWDLGFRSVVEATYVHGEPMRGARAALLLGQPMSFSMHLVAIVAIALLALPALVFVRALEHHEALAFGFVFLFLFAVAAYYYYLILCLPLLFFLADVEKPQNAAGAAFMFFTGGFGYVLFSGWGPLEKVWVVFHGWRQTFPTYYFISCLILVSVIQMVVLAGTRARRRELSTRSDVPTRS